MYLRIELPVGNPWQPLALRRAGRARLRLIRILGAVLVVLGLPNLFTGELVGVMLGTFLVLVGGYVIALPTALIRYAMRGLPKIAQTEPAVLEIAETGVRQSYASARAEYDWPAFVRAVEYPDMWLLYLGLATSVYLPKEPLTDAQRTEIAALLRNRSLLP